MMSMGILSVLFQTNHEGHQIYPHSILKISALTSVLDFDNFQMTQKMFINSLKCLKTQIKKFLMKKQPQFFSADATGLKIQVLLLQ